MKTILVPLDGSALAEQALPYARMMALLLEARITLLQVVSEADVEHVDSILYQFAAVYGTGDVVATERERMRELLDERCQRARGYLAAQAAELGKSDIDTHTEVVIGHAAEMIAEIAAHDQVSLIVMATHGYGGFRGWGLGRVGDKGIHINDTPILLVRGVAGAPAEITLPQRIMVPLDGSDLAKQALPLATRLAAAANAELMLLRAVRPIFDVEMVVPPMARTISDVPDISMTLRKYALEELQELAVRLKEQGLRSVVAAPFGDPPESIVDEAKAAEVDLIVMVTHGYGGLRRWALGSVADKVLQASTTPLLLVRAQAA